MSYEDDYYNQRLQSLIDGLVERTRAAIQADRPMWDQVEPDVYELSLTRSSMRIYSRDRDGQKPYYFELYDNSGKLVDTIEDDAWSQPVKLQELYDQVSKGEKLKAREATLSDALNELDIEEPPF
ncbi:hypothetical protein [Mycobacterium sp. DL592]|uniref:hypothetical protein n=1 Tax=Mycobacterium sp. DL592 TaxID=2675524 RepID=UPI00141DF8DE|nr:hypothetical protein [Mycobacterium sp. DL592]